MLKNASVLRLFYEILLGSEQLQISLLAVLVSPLTILLNWKAEIPVFSAIPFV